MAAPDRNAREEGATAQLRLEMLLTDISARFLSMIPQHVDAEIDGALRKIRESFDSNMCGLFRIDPRAGELFLSHVQVTEDIPVMPRKYNYAATNPWRFAKLVRGETILVKSLDELPEEAKLDRCTTESLAIQAYLIMPVQIGGTTRYALHVAFTRPGPAWLAQYVPRLQVFAEVLVTALERSSAIVAQQEAEVRLALAAGLVGAGLWDLDLSTNTYWATPRARELYGVGQNETVNLEKLFRIVHADDFGHLRR